MLNKRFLFCSHFSFDIKCYKIDFFKIFFSWNFIIYVIFCRYLGEDGFELLRFDGAFLIKIIESNPKLSLKYHNYIGVYKLLHEIMTYLNFYYNFNNISVRLKYEKFSSIFTQEYPDRCLCIIWDVPQAKCWYKLETLLSTDFLFKFLIS
jgi:hypothetical protein